MSTVPIRVSEAAYQRLQGLADLAKKSLTAIVDDISDTAYRPAEPYVRELRRVQAEAAAAIPSVIMAQHPGPLPTVGDEVDEEAIQREVRTARAAASMEERGMQG